MFNIMSTIIYKNLGGSLLTKPPYVVVENCLIPKLKATQYGYEYIKFLM